MTFDSPSKKNFKINQNIPSFSNNFDSIIESGANSIGAAANLDSYTQSINLAQQQTSVIKEEDE